MILFLQINILLVLTYFFYVAAQRLGNWFFGSSSPNASLRCAQFLILLSIIVPLAIKLVPEQKIPMSEPPFRAFQEASLGRFKQSQKDLTKFVAAAPEKVHQMEGAIHFDYQRLLIVFWAMGSFFFLGKLSINYFRLRKILLSSIVLKKTAHLKIIVTEDILTPFSVRMLKYYWVAIPINLLNSKKDLQLAIKHEIQHHRQGDTLWAVVIELLICLFYFNPIIYLWKNSIIEFQEFSCDEALTGQEGVFSHDYGSCLLRVAETALKNRQMYAGTTCMAVVFKDSKYFKTFLLRRIEMIVGEKKSTSKWIPICTAICLTLLTITVAFGVEKFSRARIHAINSGIVVVDTDIQKIAYDALNKALNGTRFSAGFVIVSDPMTGKILAVANIDTKDKKHLKKGHWALSELIEPASFAKAFIIAKALDNKVTDANQLHQCEHGKYKYKGKTYRDWKEVGWKELSTADTLAMSSDICSIKIAELLGTDSLEAMIKDFGFGEDGSAKDFPEARIGDIPKAGEQFIPKISLGYAFKTSPIEIMQAFGALANGGNLMKPIMGADQKPEVLRKVLSDDAAEKIKTLLQGVVLTGTAKGKERAESSFYTTAGKTASARLNDYMNIDWYGGARPNFAGFVGFAPVVHPRVQVMVGLIDPAADRNKTGAHGGEHAAPVFKEVAENVLAFLKVAPDKF